MSLKDKIIADMKSAMKAGEKDRLMVVRHMLAAIKQIEIDERIEIDDARVLSVLGKMVKQRRDSVAQFNQGNRTDLSEIELGEIAVIETYLPEQLSQSELDAIIDTAITASGAEGLRDMGKVMGQIKSQAAGRADMGAVGVTVKQRLGAL